MVIWEKHYPGMRNVYSQFLLVAQNRLALKLSNNNIWKSQYRSGVEQENKNSSNDNLGSTAHFPFPHFCFHFIFFDIQHDSKFFKSKTTFGTNSEPKFRKVSLRTKHGILEPLSSFFFKVCFVGGHEEEATNMKEAKNMRSLLIMALADAHLKKRCSLSQRGNSQKNSSRSLRNNPSKQRGFKCANRRC